MKQQVLFLIFFCVMSNFLFAQKDTELFEKGISLFESKEYAKADSFFTEAINLNRLSIYYYNRGVARLYLNDTLGFCSDMEVNYVIDETSKKHFDGFCGDTLYYTNKSYRKVAQSRTPYYEIIFKTNTGAFYNKEINITTLPESPYWHNENVIGFYKLIDGQKVFTYAEVRENNILMKGWDFFNENFVLNGEIKDMLRKNDINEIMIGVFLIASEKGEIIKIQKAEKPPRNITISNEDYNLLASKVIDEIQTKIKKAPRLEPSYLENKPVKYRHVTTFIVKI